MRRRIKRVDFVRSTESRFTDLYKQVGTQRPLTTEVKKEVYYCFCLWGSIKKIFPKREYCISSLRSKYGDCIKEFEWTPEEYNNHRKLINK